MGMDLCLTLYPLYQSYLATRQPRVATLQHWLTFWQVWILLSMVDVVVDRTSILWSWIPLSGSIILSTYYIGRTGLILFNYSPRGTYITQNTCLRFIAQISRKFGKKTYKDLYNFRENWEVWRYIDPLVEKGQYWYDRLLTIGQLFRQ
jgi:hypothetical protein